MGLYLTWSYFTADKVGSRCSVYSVLTALRSRESLLQPTVAVDGLIYVRSQHTVIKRAASPEREHDSRITVNRFH